MIENKDYQLLFGKKEDDWSARILTGKFTGTTIKFRDISINEARGEMSFGYIVTEGTENEALDYEANKILTAVMESCIEEGSAEFTDRATGEKVDADEVFDIS